MKAYVTRVGEGGFPTELGTYDQTKDEESVKDMKKTLSDEAYSRIYRKIMFSANNGDNYNQGRLMRMQGMEYGTTTGRPRRTGWFDVVAARYAIMINGMTSVVMTKLDVLQNVKKIKICTHYEIEGKKTDKFPLDAESLSIAEPVYEEMAGWDEDISKCTSFKELPKNAKEYVEKVEKLIGVPVSIISLGPKRRETIIIEDKDLF